MLGIEAAEALGIPKGIKLAAPPDGWGVRRDTLLFRETRASIKLADRSMQLPVPVKKRNRKANDQTGRHLDIGMCCCMSISICGATMFFFAQFSAAIWNTCSSLNSGAAERTFWISSSTAALRRCKAASSSAPPTMMAGRSLAS